MRKGEDICFQLLQGCPTAVISIRRSSRFTGYVRPMARCLFSFIFFLFCLSHGIDKEYNGISINYTKATVTHKKKNTQYFFLKLGKVLTDKQSKQESSLYRLIDPTL